MNISAPFIMRPVATTLLTIGLALSGILAWGLLPVSPLPQVDFPTIQVSSTLPGAEPDTMATSVAAPLERQFGHIAGLTEMTSTSYLGSTSIALQFDLSRNIDGAARDVQAAINAARGYLPPNLPNNPSYRKVNPADAPIMIVALTSDTLSRGRMYDTASSILQQKLSQLPGVGQVIVGGSSLPAVRVEMNPTALNQYGIALETVRGAVAATTQYRPKGQLGDGVRTSEIASNDQLLKASEYAPVIVAFRSGRPVRLSDVAQVEDSVEDVRTAGLANGRPAVLLVIFRQPGANIIDTVDGVRALLPALQAEIPGAITVLAISLSLVAVFTPILLMGGLVGRLFREFAMTLSAAIAISLLVSLTTTPMMCATLLGREANGEHGRLYRTSERAFEWMRRRYETSLAWVLRHPRGVLIVTLLTVALNGYLFWVVPKGFFPQQDTGRLQGVLQAAQDISFQAMQAKLTAIVDIVGHDPAVANVVGFTGSQGNGPSTATNTARMFVMLKPLAERKISADQVITRLRGRVAVVPGAPAFFQATQDVRAGGRMGNAQYQYTLQGDTVRELDAWGPRVAERLRALPQLVDLGSDQQDKGQQSSLVIDRATASRLGITPQLIDDTLNDAFGQRQVAILYSPLNQYHVVMEVEPRFWQRPESLQEIYLPSSKGGMVPLSAFSRYEPTRTALAVNHQAQFPAVTLTFNLAPGVALGDAVSAIEAAVRPLGLPAGIQGSFQGTAQIFQASLASQPWLIAAALLAVYVVLGVLYESYIHPLTILSTLPAAGVGALVALRACRTDLTVIALIGILLLVGIVKKNAIMMIDFALEAERGEGKSPAEAIHQACVLRFRPIMMTTMAALLGALPLAFGRGIGSELRRPLGIAIVGGLIVSQALTLYTTPVVYLYLDRVRLWWARGRAGHGRPRALRPRMRLSREAPDDLPASRRAAHARLGGARARERLHRGAQLRQAVDDQP